MSKKNKARNRAKRHYSQQQGSLSMTVAKPQASVILNMFNDEEDTDPGLEEDGATPIASESTSAEIAVPAVVIKINKQEAGLIYPGDNPVFCRLAQDFLTRFDMVTRAYLAWKHRDFDRALMGLKLDLVNKLYALQWVAKEMRDLLPRDLVRNELGEPELVCSSQYESLYQLLMPCDNEGILSLNPDERDLALFKLEQERDALKNMLKAAGY